jgi:hypothetical protein
LSVGGTIRLLSGFPNRTRSVSHGEIDLLIERRSCLIGAHV